MNSSLKVSREAESAKPNSKPLNGIKRVGIDLKGVNDAQIL